MTSPATVLIVGSLATELDEILYLRSQITSLSSNACKVNVLDTSQTAKPPSTYPTIPESELITPLLESAPTTQDTTRSDFVEKATTVCTPAIKQLVNERKIHGIVAAGSGTTTALAATIMRDACPIGFPKLLVSTMTSGDVRPYIESTDITMMYSVVDVAGLNPLLRTIFSNAAGAIAGMAMTYASLSKQMDDLKVSPSSGKRIAITMFGSTTPCVNNIRKILTSTPYDTANFEIYVFHATGSGGQAMERLIAEGGIDVVIDLTTTEIADEVCGGALSAGPTRLESATKRGIPMIVSVGACDMVNFGPRATLPDTVQKRNLSHHTPQVTTMRTNRDENVSVGKHIASKLRNHAVNPKSVRVVLPKGGLSTLDRAHVEHPTTSPTPAESQTQPPANPFKGSTGEAWHDAAANTALFETIMTGLAGSGIEVFEYPDNINDEAFAISVCEHLLEVMGDDPRKYRLANARRRKWSFDHGMTIDKLRRRNSVEIPDAA